MANVQEIIYLFKVNGTINGRQEVESRIIINMVIKHIKNVIIERLMIILILIKKIMIIIMIIFINILIMIMIIILKLIMKILMITLKIMQQIVINVKQIMIIMIIKLVNKNDYDDNNDYINDNDNNKK